VKTAVVVEENKASVFMSISEAIATIGVQPNIDANIFNVLEHCLGDYVTKMRIPSLKLRHDQA